MSTLLIDEKYIRQIASQLPLFVDKGNQLYNFRCNVCGDSEKNSRKRRAYFFRGKPGQGYFFKCHNCNESYPFKTYLSIKFPSFSKEYEIEEYMDRHGVANTTIDATNASAQTHFINSKKQLKEHIDPVGIRVVAQHSDRVSDLPHDHFVKKYLRGRRIPVAFYDDLYYTPNFAGFVKEAFPDDDHTHPADRRIIIPFYSQRGWLNGITARYLDDHIKSNWAKYIIVRARSDENFSKVWGLDKINLDERVYVTEGPFDAMLLHNGAAVQDSALSKVESMFPLKPKAGITLVTDNQPRNKEVCAAIKKAIDEGNDVFIWPCDDVSYKDINDLVLGDHLDQFELKEFIDNRTFNGQMAQFHFGRWRKTL